MKKLIVALDVNEKTKALSLIDKLSPWVDIFKVGPVLFLSEGQEIIKKLKNLKKEIFLDLKFHDIPATVKRSVESAQKMGVYSLTLHSCGGEEMLQAAASVNPRPKLWAVTVLTSQESSSDEVVKRAKLAKTCGLDGVISSPLEAEIIKKECGKDFEVITPGIRLEKTNDDQKRTATPQSAVKAGADFIVVGRPVIGADNPEDIAKKISEEISS